jgi:hypothetical protein
MKAAKYKTDRNGTSRVLTFRKTVVSSSGCKSFLDRVPVKRGPGGELIL